LFGKVSRTDSTFSYLGAIVVYGLYREMQEVGDRYTVCYTHADKGINAKINSKFYVQVQDPTLDDMECSGNTIFDLGARYQMGKHMTLQINCENVFDKTTYMSGATLIVMPWYNPGRTVLASIKYNL